MDKRGNYNFNPEDLRKLSRMSDLGQAQQFLNEILTCSSVGKSEHPIKIGKVRFLRAEIAKCDSVLKLSRLAYNMYLAGDCPIPNSRYQKMFAGQKGWR